MATKILIEISELKSGSAMYAISLIDTTLSCTVESSNPHTLAHVVARTIQWLEEGKVRA